MKFLKKHLFKKHRYDIAFHDGTGAHLITWITGLMVFFMTLTLAANIGLSSMSQSWVSGLSGSVTVEIAPPLPEDAEAGVTEAQKKDFAAKIEKILLLAKQHPAVAQGRVMPEKEVRDLIEPWLGEKIPSDLPLPTLIEMKLTAEADIARLQADIKDLVPQATVDTHQDTLKDVETLISAVRAFAFLLTGVIILLAVIAVSGIVRAKLSIHRQEVETLHLLGAGDDYIAAQFRRHALQGTFRGSLGGIAATIFTLLIIGSATHTIDTALLPHMRLMPWHWTFLIIFPLAASVILAYFTAQATVIRTLAKMS